MFQILRSFIFTFRTRLVVVVLVVVVVVVVVVNAEVRVVNRNYLKWVNMDC